jgi:type IV secretory pathway VirB4 component
MSFMFTVAINPFAFDPTPQHLNFLHAFVRVLLEISDDYRLSEAEDRELYEAVTNVYALDRSERRLRTVPHLLPRALAGRLQKWVDGGRYARVFDNEEDTVTVAPLQVFDFDAMQEYGAVVEPLLFYLLHRVVLIETRELAWHRANYRASRCLFTPADPVLVSIRTLQHWLWLRLQMSSEVHA